MVVISELVGSEPPSPAGNLAVERRVGKSARNVRSGEGGNRGDATSSSQLDWMSDPMRLDSRTPVALHRMESQTPVSVVRQARPE
jgi:hypothetical protein